MQRQGDKAGKQYWDSLWANDHLPPPIDIQVVGGANWVERLFHEELTRVLCGPDREVRSVIEIGCARSRWLPHLKHHLDVDVTGLDYSEVGCEAARRLLEREGKKGEIVCADFFDPPERMVGKFDALVSFGVAEHFVPTQRCLHAFARFLRPGGVMFTSIPNMVGATGAMQRFASQEVFEKHVPLTSECLRSAHEGAGLRVESCDYFVSVNAGVIALSQHERFPTRLAKRVLFAGLGRLSRLVWRFENALAPLPAVEAFAAYVNCVAVKPVH